KALQSRAAIALNPWRPAEAMYFYNEALKTDQSISDYVRTQRAIASVKSGEGFARAALEDLEALIPLLRHTEPFVRYDVLNSYAVELAAAGRLAEAQNVSRVVLTSPFAPSYSEWQETSQDIQERLGPPRNVVAVKAIQIEPENVLRLPTPSGS